MTEADFEFCEKLSGLTYCNPFLPQRIQLEKECLGQKGIGVEEVWHMGMDPMSSRPTLKAIKEKAAFILMKFQCWIQGGGTLDDKKFRLYEDLVTFHIYHLVHEELESLIDVNLPGRKNKLKTTWGHYSTAYEKHFHPAFLGRATPPGKEHLFACSYQVRRAFSHTFGFLAGRSKPAVNLRASIWQSLFTHDPRRYRQFLYKTLPLHTTLITGPSGTGKELVARAIGKSGYQAFDPVSMSFEGDDQLLYTELNLSALPSTLVESELFGHSKGSFTGALKDRVGRLEACPAQGSVFIDEIGEIDESIQVKLLRVLQGRTFQRVGENSNRRFLGKCLAATNRDLEKEIKEGHFRRDLYYRLCSDQVRTPSLKSILQSEPDELLTFLNHIARKSLPEEACEAPVMEAEAWIRKNISKNYAWSGNFRELEQCFNNLLIRGDYQPSSLDSVSTNDSWLEGVNNGVLTADEVLNVYCKRVFDRYQNYEEAGRALSMDPRTVKARANKACER
jgi:hypothetical protein